MVFEDVRDPERQDRLATVGQVLARVSDVVFAYLFGSQARGRHTPGSDIDIAIYIRDDADPSAPTLDALGLLTSHLKTDDVDLVVLNSAPDALLGRILADRRIVLDGDPLLRHRFESLALRRHFDFRVVEHRLLAARYASG